MTRIIVTVKFDVDVVVDLVSNLGSQEHVRACGLHYGVFELFP